MSGVVGARAVAALRARPGAALVAGVGLFLLGVLTGIAAVTAYALSTGFDRAQHAAGTADFVARFDPASRASVDARIGTVANVADRSYRLSVRPVDLGVEQAGGRPRFGTAQVDGLVTNRPGDGLIVVSGRRLSGAPDEALVERGLADAWHLRVGQRLALRGARGPFVGRIVGIVVEPDGVAFPLAARPRVYVPYGVMRDRIASIGGADPVSALYVHVVNPSLLPQTLVAARSVSYGITGLSLATRTGVRAAVNQASGLVVALLTAFAAIALVAAAAMLAASAQARVTRELPTIGTLRAIGLSAGPLAATYALETAIVALPAVALGVATGALVVAGPTDRLLLALNELPPPRLLGWPEAVAVAAAVALAAAAAALPAFLAARQPIVETLRGAAVVRPRRSLTVGRPALLGARLALARPTRLVVGVVAVAVALSVVFLLLALARFLVSAEREPSAIGERYALLVQDRPGALERVRETRGVAAAALRYQVDAVDAYDLGQPVRVVAFGAGGPAVFAGRPLLSGRRAVGAGETEVGRGMAQTLGLEVGSSLVLALAQGGQLRLRVVGIVQELANDGRIAYADAASLRTAAPGLAAQIAVRPAAGMDVQALRQRLGIVGLSASVNGGLAPEGAPFLQTIVVLLRTVAVADGIVCAALLVLAVVVLARERTATVGVVRALGGGFGDVAGLLAGAAALHVALAVPAAWALERFVAAPALSGLADRYGALPLAPAAADVALISLAAAAVALLTGAAVAFGRSRASVIGVLHAE